MTTTDHLNVPVETGRRRSRHSMNSLRNGIRNLYRIMSEEGHLSANCDVFEDEPEDRTRARSQPPPYADASLVKGLPGPVDVDPVVEGAELLPCYSCSLSAEAVFPMKKELHSQFRTAGSRQWNKVYVVLRGTMLNVHRVKHVGHHPFGHGPEPDAEDPLRGVAAGQLIRSYTLQHAEVGIAVDYKKLPSVIRIRAETDQFLLSCGTVEIFLHWLEQLNAAISLALPLDERTLPSYRTLPMRRRGRRSGSQQQQKSNEEPPTTVAVQERLLNEIYERRQRERRAQGLLTTDESEEASNSQSSSGRESPANPASASSSSSHHEDFEEHHELQPTSTSESQASMTSEDGNEAVDPIADMDSHLSNALAGLELLQRSASANDAHVSSDLADGKWHPTHPVNRTQQLSFARRCMPTLRFATPRQKDIVIHKGQLCRINWTDHKLEPYVPEPPAYAETEEDEQRETAITATAAAVAALSAQDNHPARPAGPIRAHTAPSHQLPLRHVRGSIDGMRARFGNSKSRHTSMEHEHDQRVRQSQAQLPTPPSSGQSTPRIKVSTEDRAHRSYFFLF
ncbi:hypothetical protein L228DRAFT_61276 [Xylona heveae TC161]|uniref:PH domain-containing protein n=1 Tax=Xylona heveae (strain CBS 132557 / TC161) TaxID=1328760 RepID=A0A165ILY9_XYLHT|nr:hypothetical protein L228DRAFT_61276 [Xylona heveae TC161]KZF25085.1 hypothetical protein L228DRAFT_61276 [Xylona heveae TC161]